MSRSSSRSEWSSDGAQSGWRRDGEGEHSSRRNKRQTKLGQPGDRGGGGGCSASTALMMGVVLRACPRLVCFRRHLAPLLHAGDLRLALALSLAPVCLRGCRVWVVHLAVSTLSLLSKLFVLANSHVVSGFVCFEATESTSVWKPNRSADQPSQLTVSNREISVSRPFKTVTF